MKKILLAGSLILIISGCSVNSEKIEIKKTQYNQEGYSITMEIPKFTGNSEFISNFNNQYTELSESIVNTFSQEAEKSDIPKDSLEFTQRVNLNKNGVISITGDCTAFTGGPHGTLSRIAKNVDITGEKVLTLKDLFSDGEYVKRLNSYIETLMKENPGDFTDLWKIPTIGDDQGFFLTENGIVIFYPPYELSYYSKGFVEIEIPYRELESYLNPEYKGRIW